MAALSALAPEGWKVPPSGSDESLLDQFCRGSEAAFNALVDRYHAAMIRLAKSYVSAALAEEAAQEAWIAIFRGCRRFERRSSLRTWMFRVLINRARTHGAREARDHRFIASALDRELEEPSVDAARFHSGDHPLEGSWIVPPRRWTPEEVLLTAEVRDRIEAAIASLPFLQRQVITLRDVEGWSSRDVYDPYGISESNQRVLLHRARARLRQVLENFLS